MSKRCLSGQRVPLWLDFFGSFCVKTKRTQEEVRSLFRNWSKVEKLAIKKCYGLVPEKSVLLKADKVLRYRSGWQRKNWYHFWLKNSADSVRVSSLRATLAIFALPRAQLCSGWPDKLEKFSSKYFCKPEEISPGVEMTENAIALSLKSQQYSK